jgi:predicted PurR-regulated permease PerM
VLVEVCIVLVTIALLGAGVALAIFLRQAHRTARQLESTLAHFDANIIPSLVRATEDMRGAFDSMSSIMHRVDRITSDVQHASGKARDISSTVVNRFLVPAGELAAIVRGVKVGAAFLKNGLGRSRRSGAGTSGGGNHHE